MGNNMDGVNKLMEEIKQLIVIFTKGEGKDEIKVTIKLMQTVINTLIRLINEKEFFERN